MDPFFQMIEKREQDKMEKMKDVEKKEVRGKKKREIHKHIERSSSEEKNKNSQELFIRLGQVENFSLFLLLLMDLTVLFGTIYGSYYTIQLIFTFIIYSTFSKNFLILAK